MLPPIDFKLNRMLGQHLGKDACKIGVPPARFRHALIRNILVFPDSNSKMLCPINLKLNRVIGHVTTRAWLLFNIGLSPFACFGHVHPSKIFWFPDSPAKTLYSINLKLNRMIGHHQGLVGFDNGVHPFACFGYVWSHPCYSFWTLT